MKDALITDYYQFSMLETYIKKGLKDIAAFEFFVRKLPENRNFLIAVGLQQVLQYLENIRFSNEELSYLDRLGFSKELLDYLEDFCIEADVWAMPEGTIFFANEPVLRVEAPLPQAQLIETRLVNIIHYQSLLASKAIRASLSARDKILVDFGLRRSHGAEAGIFAARACYVAGFAATATVEAGRLYGIPVTGTMAHSYVLAHDTEEEAFINFIETHPENAILLIDTFDPIKGSRLALRLYKEYLKRGIKIKGVRIDSGDYLSLSKKIRQIFDLEGARELKIFCSGGLDEYSIVELCQKGAPIDGFGLGTLIDTSTDAPYLDCAYKMVEYAGRPKMKLSEKKATLPYKKQVVRVLDREGKYKCDVITKESEDVEGQKLLVKVMEKGKTIYKEDLGTMRNRVKNQLLSMPKAIQDIDKSYAYQVRLSKNLEKTSDFMR